MGNLYIVSTPIGNLQDITLRAAFTLLDATHIVAESTSKAGTLLSFLEEAFKYKKNQDQKIISLTEDEEENKIPSIISQLENSDLVLISEAGTPLVSDPGFKLVREAIKHGANVISIPGATAAITALTSSGLPSDKFLFLGFLPKSDTKKENIFKSIKASEIKYTTIIYESPARLIDTLKIIQQVFGEIDIVTARELTKMHEEVKRGNVSEIVEHFTNQSPKGEFTILF